MKQIVAALVVVALAGPAHAVSGAQFIQLNQSSAVWYAWGVLEAILVFRHPGMETEALLERQQCITRSGIDGGGFYAVVQNHIRNNPSLLGQPAPGAIAQVLDDMCPLP